MRNKKGFTLMELLIVIAIIAVLVAVAIPTLTASMEKSREATDLANIRGAYAEVMTAGMTGENPEPINLTLQQKKAGWVTDSAEATLNHLTNNNVSGELVDGTNTALVEWVESTQSAKITFNGSSSGGGTEGEGGPVEETTTGVQPTKDPDFQRGTVISDGETTIVLTSYNEQFMRDYNSKKDSESLKSICEGHSNFYEFDPSNIKDSSSGEINVGDIYYDAGDYYYVTMKTYNNQNNGSWLKLTQ